MVDKELLKEYHLEDMQKRFQQISEYTFITKPILGEDDDDNNGQQNPQQYDGAQMPTQDGNASQQGIGMPQNGQMPPQQPNDNMMNQQAPVPPMDGGMPPMDGGTPPMDGGMSPMDGGMPPMGGDVPPMDSMQAGDEVIDVDELTNAQETTDIKIDGVNDKLQNLLSVTTKFIAAVDQNNKKLDDLKAEFERRNPTEEEKLNIRSQASAPYFETPREFWDKKKGSNYNVIFNNDVDPDKEEEEYVIKRGDIDNVNDRMLSNSLDFPSKVSDYLNF